MSALIQEKPTAVWVIDFFTIDAPDRSPRHIALCADMAKGLVLLHVAPSRSIGIEAVVRRAISEWGVPIIIADSRDGYDSDGLFDLLATNYIPMVVPDINGRKRLVRLERLIHAFKMNFESQSAAFTTPSLFQSMCDLWARGLSDRLFRQ